jgi:glycerol-3-phosphate dehydrogenase (NAD(P)+)
MAKIGIIGYGAWGTALGQVLVKENHIVKIWGRDDKKIKFYNNHVHDAFNGIKLEKNLIFTSHLQEINDSDYMILAIPTQQIKNFLPSLKTVFKNPIPIIQTAKGIDIETGIFPFQLIQKILPEFEILLLSGPSFAIDVAQGLPTAVTLAYETQKIGEDVQLLFKNTPIRPYLSDDLMGVSLGGAIKNVLALICGMVMGYELGESARASIITRGFAEIQRLGAFLGVNSDTLMGLSGMGDLILTSTSLSSRNYAMGIEIGKSKGKNWDIPPHKTVEGIGTAIALYNLAKKNNISIPICEAVYHIINKDWTLENAMQRLMSRPLKHE